jgi:glyoxylase-like metal-dependent hydrolase (beta-lactamase superfamily II)
MNDGDLLDIPGRPRIIHVPGHTQGSVSLLVRDCDALFVGDALSTRNVLNGTVGPATAPFTLDWCQAIRSFERLKAVDATWMLPGHGPAWDGGVTQAVRIAKDETAPATDGSIGAPLLR